VNDRMIRALFVVAGLYDGVLGVAFLLFGGTIFDHFGVTPPHPAYYEFSAMLLVVFALLFFQVARNPVKTRGLILYGCGLKVAYCATVFRYALSQGIPSMWLPWAWADLAFLGLFVLAWQRLGRVAD